MGEKEKIHADMITSGMGFNFHTYRERERDVLDQYGRGVPAENDYTGGSL